MSVLGNTPLLMTPEGYQISRSVRTRSSATGYFSRTPAGAGNRKTWTWSGWVKLGDVSATGRCLFGTMVTSSYTTIGIDVSGQGTATIGMESVSGTTTVLARVYTNAVLRDPSAWYHIVVAVDTTNATSTDRFRIYINGVRMSVTEPIVAALNTDHFINQASVSHGLMAGYTTAYCMDGYIAEVNFIDGQALTPSSFGENDVITGVWKPKKYAGTYGTNGFYLNFSDNSAATAAAIGKDYSGNGNNWTPNNISLTSGATYDSMLDVPTPYADGGNGRGNYCVMNPVYVNSTGNPTVSDGNLTVLGQSYGKIGTVSVNSGKWYWEATCVSQFGGGYLQVGIADPTVQSVPTGPNPGVEYVSSANKRQNGGSLTAYGATWAANDVIGVALDLDGGTITFYKNGVSQGTAYSSLSGNFAPYLGGSGGGNSNSMVFNFGQRPFAYTPPTGFKALNTQNLPDSTIKKGNAYFDASLYTGTGSALSVTNSGSFQPDLVWIKGRSSAYNHGLFDSSRGVRNVLQSSATAAEVLESAGTSMTSFDAGGFSLGTNGGTVSTNVNAQTFVGWQWKKGATPGFDIVTWTGNSTSGRTVAHSLGVAPKLIITKGRTNATSWTVGIGGMTGFGVNDYLSLNTTDAKSSSSTFYQAYGSSTFTVGVSAANEMNKTGNDYVSYLFAEVAGFSKFGSYTGNGSTDGPFVYLGFRPRFVMIKRTDTTADWEVIDTARDTYNAAANYLYPDTSAAEANAPSNTRDYLSNGFKIRHSGAGANASGGTYIFAAFAENPFKNSLAR